MYLCFDCGCVFPRPTRWEEGYGCPRCAGAFACAIYCPACGRYFYSSKIWRCGLCHACAGDQTTGGRTDVENAKKRAGLFSI